MKDEEMDDNTVRDASEEPNLLTAPSVLSPDSLAVADLSSRETSNGSRTAEGGGGVDKDFECGDCPACKANAYLDEFGPVVTDVAHMGEGVWIGPDKESFNAETFHYIGTLENGIAALAIEDDNPEAWMWYEEQLTLQILANAGLI